MAQTIKVDNKDVPHLDLTEKQRDAYNEDIHVMCGLREEFNAAREELDGMNRAEYYESNRKKDLSYLPPKKNKTDVRVVTGTTREKDTTLLSTLLNINAVPNFTAFDTDDLIVSGLGDDMSDLHKKSREVELWDKKRPIIYREMISQGDVFVEEVYEEEFREVPLTEVEWDPEREGVSELSFTSRIKKIHSGCAARMVRGNMIYLGDMSIEYIEDQDIVAVCRLIPRSMAAARYGLWERWKYVPNVITGTDLDLIEFSAGTYSKDRFWAMFASEFNYVSEVQLFKKSQNRYQIYLNGIPMMPHNMPLTARYRSGDLPFAQGKFEPISNFALSKSQPSKTKVDQETVDELTKLFIEGMRQKRKPPMGNKSDKVYSPGIFAAGTITPEVDANTFHSILPDSALRFDGSEFSFYNLVKENINEKTTNEVYSGDGQANVDTLGQAEIMKEQALLRLGAAVDGMVNLERRLAWLRIENIIVNWTAPVDETLEATQEGVLKQVRKYRNLSAETTTEEGKTGLKLFRFTEDPFPTMGEQYQEEEELSKSQNKPIRITYWNPERLRAMKYRWFILINPTPKTNDKISQLLFVQNIRTAYELFGPDSLNLDYVKQRFAILINEDYNKFFKAPDLLQMLQQQQALTQQGQTGGNGPNPMKPAVNPVASKQTVAAPLTLRAQ